MNIQFLQIKRPCGVPQWQNKGFKLGLFPSSELYYSKAISLPIFYDLNDEMQDSVINVLQKSCL